MRKLRAAAVGILLALPAALVLPGAVPAAASVQCPGSLNLGSFSVTLATTHGTTGTTIYITGSFPALSTYSFNSGGSVYFPNDGAAHQFVADSPTQLHVSAPSTGYSGQLQVCISGNNYSGATTPQRFAYTPEVKSVPAATEGQGITVGGKFLSGVPASVNFSCGSVQVAGSSVALTTLSVSVPNTYCPGQVTVSQTAWDGTPLNGTAGSSLTIKPTFSSMSPGTAYPTQAVTVHGTGFGGGGSVSGAAGSVTAWSDTAVTFQAPDGTEGGGVTVNAPGGSISAGSLTVVPHISSISPTSAHDGDTVTINGQDFGSAPGSVSLNGQTLDASNVAGWGMDQIQFVVPAGAVPGQVAVTAGWPDHPTVAGPNLNLVPVISSVSPSSAAPGAYVTITGSTFGQSGGSVTIGGKAAQIADWADTAIIAVVPNGATTGKLVVNSGYGQAVTWGQTFTVPAGAAPSSGGGTTSGSSGGGYNNYTNSGTLNVKPNYGFLPLPKPPPGVDFHLTAPATDVKPGALVDLTVNLQINGKPVAGAPITFQVASSPGSDTVLSAPSAVTDQNGIAHVTLKTSRKPGQTIVVAHSGAFGDQLRILTLAPAAAGGVGTTILRTTSTLDPHVLIPFVGALILAVLLLLGTVILQFVLHRRQRVPAAVAVTPAGDAVALAAADAAEMVAVEPAAAPKPRKPRTRKPKAAPANKPAEAVDPVALDLAAGAEDIAPVIPLRADSPEQRITRTRARARARD